MHKKVTWIYVSYDEMMHPELNILIFLNSMRLSNVDTLIHLMFGQHLSIWNLDPIKKDITLTLVDDTLDTCHAWDKMDLIYKVTSLISIYNGIDNACD